MKRVAMFLAFLLIVGAGRPAAAKDDNDNEYGDYLIVSTQKLISLDLENADLIDILKLLSQQTGLNFVAGTLTRGHAVTLYLDKTPLKEAMDIIFKANNIGYDYYPQANIFVVKNVTPPPAVELITRVFPLKYARVQASAVTSEKGSVLGYTAGTQLIEAVNKVLSPAGKAIEDSFTNAIIVTDAAAQLKVVEQVIKEIDIPAPQVLIEVEMLDVTKGAVDKIGVDWPGALASLDVTGQKGTAFPFGQSKSSNLDGTTWSSLTSPGGVDLSGLNSSPDKFAPSVLTVIGSKLVLTMLRNDSSTKFLARPKILTLSNEPAEVNLTVDEVIGTTVNNTATVGNTNTTETAERAQTGSKLRVTPQVNPDTKEITMVVQITDKEATDSGIKVNNSETKNVEERGTKSMVRLKNGETLLIGGLIKRTTDTNMDKVPFLGDIPLLGKVFRYNTKTEQDRELLVFLTPRVISGSDNVDGSTPVSAAGGLVSREQHDAIKSDSMKSALDVAERSAN